MRVRATLSTAVLAAAGAGAAFGVPVHASPGGGGCSLTGSAKFKHGPSTSSHSFTYTFKGKLANCDDSTNSGVTSGTIATLLPAKGSGTCGNGTTAGTALITWSDKTRSGISYTTNSAGAEVVLQGNVVKKYTVKKKTYKSTRYVGDGALGNLVFQANPQQCAGSGVTTAPITGFAGLGSES
jgi:hypothetical protein